MDLRPAFLSLIDAYTSALGPRDREGAHLTFCAARAAFHPFALAQAGDEAVDDENFLLHAAICAVLEEDIEEVSRIYGEMRSPRFRSSVDKWFETKADASLRARWCEIRRHEGFNSDLHRPRERR